MATVTSARHTVVHARARGRRRWSDVLAGAVAAYAVGLGAVALCSSEGLARIVIARAASLVLIPLLLCLPFYCLLLAVDDMLQELDAAAFDGTLGLGSD